MRSLLALAALLAAMPAAAQIRAVPAQPASEKEALRGVEVFLVNEGDAPADAEGPKEIEVTAADGTRLVLERMPAPRASVPPGGFVKARYVPVGIAGVAVPPAEAHPPAEVAAAETVVPTSAGSSAGFLDRFEPHDPIYGVFGYGDAGAKLQVSLAMRPFEGAGVLDNLRFAYTQTMFWAIEQPSGPFRSTIYSPEVYAQVPVRDDLTLGFGWRHDSNGRGAGSIDSNRLWIRAAKRFDLADGWSLELAPEAWIYVGKQGVATDLSDYWGYTGLRAAVRQEDGIKLALTARGNFETGRGAAELFASYPLGRLGGGFGIYLFGQAFTGHGETLDGYNLRDTQARIGIALTR
ncbi:phospholipase A [Sphingomonas canadensis]|uniref:Phospholipase A1 n=1 Tax=Sphingomonas canadensis TaxID=1219257 RepID=A0ABW3H2A2_9SPHN|nr:phospholipase A [Sphingomonas canadensis]MCW3835103.1 phospholipase A [Sphingomonas canadensis]